MSNEENKTLMQTIRVKLEWTKKGTLKAFSDIHGSWYIVEKPPTSSLVRYFTPQYQEEYDQFGQLKQITHERLD